MIELQDGDIVLVKQTKGLGWFISGTVMWWQNSDVASHVGVVIDAKNLKLYDARMFQRSKIIDFVDFFNGQHTLQVLRYNPELTNEQKTIICGYLNDKIDIRYDVKSILSLLINKNIENDKRLNCAEATILSYKSAGLFRKRTSKYIVPHTFWEYYIADRFTTVCFMKEPTKEKIGEFLV